MELDEDCGKLWIYLVVFVVLKHFQGSGPCARIIVIHISYHMSLQKKKSCLLSPFARWFQMNYKPNQIRGSVIEGIVCRELG